MNLMNKQNYSLSADFIRVLAIAGVVMIHTSNAVFARPDFFGGISWWIAIILNSISRASIPLFVMISGYFLLQKNESFSTASRRAWHRLVVPLLFWFVAMVIWNRGQPSFEHVNVSLITRLLTVNVFDLYFFIILAGLYVVSPLLRSFLKKTDLLKQRNFMVGLLIAGCLYAVGEFLFDLCARTNVLIYWVPYTGLFVAGFVLGQVKKTAKTALLSLYALSLGATVTLSYFYFLLHNRGNALLDARSCLTPYGDYYLSINVVLMALCAFLLLLSLDLSSLSSHLRLLIHNIARASLGIFVLHTFILDIFDSWFHLFDPIAPAWLYLLIKWLVIFTISYVVTTVLIKIPIVKRAFGETR